MCVAPRLLLLDRFAVSTDSLYLFYCNGRHDRICSSTQAAGRPTVDAGLRFTPEVKDHKPVKARANDAPNESACGPTAGARALGMGNLLKLPHVPPNLRPPPDPYDHFSAGRRCCLNFGPRAKQPDWPGRRSRPPRL